MVLGVATLALSLLYGFASLRLVEKPTAKLGRTQRLANVAMGREAAMEKGAA